MTSSFFYTSRPKQPANGQIFLPHTHTLVIVLSCAQVKDVSGIQWVSLNNIRPDSTIDAATCPTLNLAEGRCPTVFFNGNDLIEVPATALYDLSFY